MDLRHDQIVADQMLLDDLGGGRDGRDDQTLLDELGGRSTLIKHDLIQYLLVLTHAGRSSVNWVSRFQALTQNPLTQ